MCDMKRDMKEGRGKKERHALYKEDTCKFPLQNKINFSSICTYMSNDALRD